MRRAALLLVPLFFACGTTTPAAPPTPTEFSYKPTGCTYEVKPSASLGLVDVTLDDPAAITNVSAAAPVRVRLGLGAPAPADPSTTASFTWETAGPVKAAKIRFGAKGSAPSEVRTGYSWTTPTPAVGFGTGEPPANMHEVHVCGLQPGTTYSYQVGGGSGAGEVWSDAQEFTTVPATGTLTIGVSGDSRDDKSVFQLVQLRMRDAGAILQLFSGDLVLWGTQASLYDGWLDAAWKDPSDPAKFLTMGQQYFVPVPGNHENGAAQFYGNFAIPTSGANAETVSSLDVGSAHVLLLDDQSLSQSASSDRSKAQLAFIEQDLAAADAGRSAHPFVLVMNHRGIFSTANHGDDGDVEALRNVLAPIFDKYHVDLVLNGHDHNYERSKAITGTAGTPTAGGTTYIVCAGAGANGYAPGTAPSPYREKNVAFGGSTAYVGVYGLITLEAKKLSFKAYGLKASGGGVAGDDLVDTIDLTK